MPLAFSCVFALIFIPWLVTGYGKYRGGFTVSNNRNTREFYAKASGVAARANAAQLNSYEIFPAFAATVLIAHLSGNVTQSTVDICALLFFISRVIYCWLYIADYPTLRSAVWTFGVLCLVTLFALASV